MHRPVWIFMALLCALSVPVPAAQAPAWEHAHHDPPLTAAETRDLMMRLARFAFDNHVKKRPDSEQRGMVYEFLDMGRKGQRDAYVQGEALDAMHDGAWFAVALVNAHRATGDPFYKELLTEWVLPFYLEMANHSDTLFGAKRNDARPGTDPFPKSHALQDGEKGFVPYWWDDGGSVSVEMRRDKNPRGFWPCVDRFVMEGRPNPGFLLNGYSQGMSNHLAQDISAMLQQVWLLLRESREEKDRKLAGEVAEAAKNVHECRLRHYGRVPMCMAAAALTNGDAALMQQVVMPPGDAELAPNSHTYRALYAAKPGQPMPAPAHADETQFAYYVALARNAGRLPRPAAFELIYSAFTEPMLYRCYSDDAEVPAGLNRAEGAFPRVVNGRLEHYRSERKGPGGKPQSPGARLGPQLMVCAGWALQALRTYPGLWEEPYRKFAQDARVFIDDPAPGARAEATPRAQVALGGTALRLGSTRAAFLVEGECRGEDAVVKVFGRPDSQGSHAALTLRRDGRASAVNDAGELLRLQAKITAVDGGFRFDAALPYAVAKEQKPWVNAVEHGRYSIRVADATRNFYLASAEEQVRAWLEHELGRGLRTWDAVFRERGYLSRSLAPGTGWDGYSESGGYAHLLSAGAQWLFCLEGKRDWER